MEYISDRRKLIELAHYKMPYGKCKDPIGCSMPATRGLNVLEEL